MTRPAPARAKSGTTRGWFHDCLSGILNTFQYIGRLFIPRKAKTVRTVRAAVLESYAQPIEIRQLEQPALQRDGILVDVTQAGICGTDVHILQGNLPGPLPLILGHEAVGRVRELGPGVAQDALGQILHPGDLVGWASSISCGTCYYCGAGEVTLCENRRVYGINQPATAWPYLSGGWADQIYLRPGTTVVRLPAGVEPQQVIALGCAGPTVIHGLSLDTTPQLNDGIVVVQGSGPVGLAACMYAKLRGASQVILVGAPANRLRVARELGACDLALDIDELTDPMERVEQVLAQTPRGRGADLVIEATGIPSAVDESMRLARRNGVVLVLGQYTDKGFASLNPHLITRKQLTMRGSWAFGPKHYLEYVRSLDSLSSRFQLHRLVTTYDLADVNTALKDMRSGDTIKPVLICQRNP